MSRHEWDWTLRLGALRETWINSLKNRLKNSLQLRTLWLESWINRLKNSLQLIGNSFWLESWINRLKNILLKNSLQLEHCDLRIACDSALRTSLQLCFQVLGNLSYFPNHLRSCTINFTILVLCFEHLSWNVRWSGCLFTCHHITSTSLPPAWACN